MATTAQNRNVVVVGIECASNSYGWLLATRNTAFTTAASLSFAHTDSRLAGVGLRQSWSSHRAERSSIWSFDVPADGTGAAA
jgi:hypothetical protein